MAVFSYNSRIDSEVGEVLLSPVGDTVTNFVFNYTSNTPEKITKSDYTSVISSVITIIDLGDLNTPSIQLDYQYVIIVSQDISTKLFGSSSSSKSYSLISSGNITLSPGKDKNGVIFTWVGNGTLFEIGGDITRIVAPGITGPPKFASANVGTGKISILGLSFNSHNYQYKSVSTPQFINGDYGNLSIYSTTSDYGSISNSLINEYVDNGLLSDELRFGSYNISSSSIANRVKPFIGTGSLSSLRGSSQSETNSFITENNFNLFKISGSAYTFKPRNNTTYSYSAPTALLYTAGSSAKCVSYQTYNISSSSLQKVDSGTINTTGDSSVYGYISNSSDSELNYGYIIPVLPEYNKFSVYNNYSKTLSTRSFFGSGTTSIIGSATSTTVQPVPQIYIEKDYGLYKVSGSASTFAVPKYESSGSLFTVGGSASSISYSYTFGSIEYFSTLDLGTVNTTGTTSDYGSISVGSDSKFNYGSIIVTQTEFPYRGIISVTGAATTQKYNVYTQVGSGTLNLISGFANAVIHQGKKNLESTDLFIISGTPYITLTNKFFGSGSLSTRTEIISKTSSATYYYNSSSGTTFSSNDFGTIITSGSTINYNSISVGSDTELNYGYIIDTNNTYPFGNINLNGIYKPARTFGFIGSGFNTISGSSTTSLVQPVPQIYLEKDYGLYGITGFAKSQKTVGYEGTGKLFNIGYHTETVTYNYHIDSFNEYTNLDYQTITASGVSVNYGSIDSNQNNYSSINYGYITIFDSLRAYQGNIKISGSPKITFVPLLIYTSTGGFKVSGAVSSIGILSAKAKPESTDLYNISGTAASSITRPVFTEISKFNTFSSAAETTAKVYNKFSINEFNNIDYQSIINSGSLLDYNFISDSSDSSFDYGNIINIGTATPYGSISIRGAVFDSRLLPYKGSGSLSTIDGAAEAKVNSTATETQLFKVSGAANVKSSFGYETNGSLFSIGNKIETVTYHYNRSSIVSFSNIDYQLITGSGTIENYDLISNSSDSSIDYGTIVFTSSNYPFGTLRLSGSVRIEYKPTFTQIGSGSLFSTGGGANAKLIISKTETQLFDIFGSSVSILPRRYTSSGSLFEFGSKNESATYTYNLSSINPFSFADYEYIISSASSTIDYGLTSESSAENINLGYIVNRNITYPYGRFAFSGQSSIEFYRRPSYIGAGSTNISGNAGTKIVPNIDETILFNIYGSADTPFSRPYIATGSLFSIGNKIETVTYSYNTSSSVLFNNFDYQFINQSGTSENYDLISNINTNLTDYGSIVFTSSNYPFGTLKLSGSVRIEYKPTFTQIGSGTLFATYGSAESTVIGITTETQFLNIYGSANCSTNRIYNSSGSLFKIGSTAESRTYAYNQHSIVDFSTSDYQFIDSSSSIYKDYGLTSESSAENINLGYIVNKNTLYPYGRFIFTGQSSIEFYRRPSYIGSGSTNISGNAGTKIVPNIDETILFNIYGSAGTPFSRYYNATGSLFNIGSKDESRTYIYNSSSIVAFSGSDYEYINSSASVYRDYGLVSEVSVGNIDFGYITTTDIAYPFGSIKFISATSTSFTPRYVSSGSFFTFNGSVQSSVVSAKTETTLFTISGTSKNIRGFGYSGIGSLFDIGTKVEKATYSYNQSSITVYSTNDYDYITNNANETIDRGLISEFATSINLGYITDSGIAYPFGSFKLSGSVAPRFTKATYITSGSLFAINGSAQTATKSYRTETSLFNISGAANVQRIFEYPTTGSLFNIGTTIESRAYVYNESSIIDYNTLDYQEISQSAQVSNDYGSVTEGSSESYNYGSVFDTDIVYPYGGLNISGGSVENFAPILAWRGSGSIRVSGSVYIVFNLSAKVQPTDDDTIKISGTSKCLFSLAHYGSGSIFNVGKKIERATYSYNTSSILPYQTSDYQFISSIAVTTPDYGYVTEPGYGSNDFGSIQNLEYAYPFGSVKLSNSVSTLISPKHFGSGSLFGIGGESNSYSRIARSETQLFVASGNAQTPRSKVFTGSGSLFTFKGLSETKAVNPPTTGLFRISGTATEKATDAWKGTGSITLQTGIYPEYLYYRPTPRYVNSIYGNIGGSFNVSGNGTTKPIAVYTNVASGITTISGSAATTRTRPFIGAGVEFVSGKLKESFSKGNYAGSGSLFTFQGLTESSTKVVPSETRLYRTSGIASIAQTDSYRGTGFLFTTKGSAQSFTYSAPPETQLFKVSGIATTLHTNNFVGSGSLFSFKSAAESTSSIPSTETSLFTISSAATTSYNTVYTSSVGGTEFISGEATNVRFVPSFTGSGSLFTFNGLTESFIRTLPTETRLYTISGSATTIRSGSYVGSGTEFISSVTTITRGNIYNGSGSLFTFKGATESKTDVSTSTILFELRGSADESFIRTTYYGSGTISILRGAAEASAATVPTETQLFTITGTSTQSTTKGNYASSGSEFISGADTESIRKIYVGSGPLFTFKSAAESTSFTPVSEITDLKIYGSAKTTRTESYQGTGTEFIYNSAAESRTYPTYNGSGSEFISGSADKKTISTYSGNGNISEFGGSAQSTFKSIPTETLLYRISGTAETSFNVVYTEKTSGQFTYTGNADLLHGQAFTGSGSLFAFNSATVTQRVTIVTETNLFRISGGERNSYTRIYVLESGYINTYGNSTDQKVSFTPARIFGTII